MVLVLCLCFRSAADSIPQEHPSVSHKNSASLRASGKTCTSTAHNLKQVEKLLFFLYFEAPLRDRSGKIHAATPPTVRRKGAQEISYETE